MTQSKLDLAALKAKAQAAIARGAIHDYPEKDAAILIALVDRIGELEAGYRQLMHDHVRCADEEPMYALLEKGVVLQ